MRMVEELELGFRKLGMPRKVGSSLDVDKVGHTVGADAEPLPMPMPMRLLMRSLMRLHPRAELTVLAEIVRVIKDGQVVDWDGDGLPVLHWESFRQNKERLGCLEYSVEPPASSYSRED
jgi:hypothetical protein